MTRFTIDQDIDFLFELADEIEDYAQTPFVESDSERLRHLATRLQEIEAIMPLVFLFVPPEAIDRSLDMLDAKRLAGDENEEQVEFTFIYPDDQEHLS